MKVRGYFGPKLSPQNQLDIYFLTVWEYWLGIAKLKNVFRSILNPSIKIVMKILKILYLADFSTD